MEAKLKALKVVDLKQILAKASQPAPAKANKQELISRILASDAAQQVYNDQHGAPPPANDDLLAPPEDVDWATDEVTAEKPPTVAAPQPAQPATDAVPPDPVERPPTPKPAASAPAPASTPEDAELEKRKQRAARFGIPLVEPKSKQTSAAAKKNSVIKAVEEDPSKRQARRERFGDTKRKLEETTVDPEELERRKKRAERFGLKMN